MAINYNGNSVKVINYAEKNNQPNDVKRVIKDGVVVWCKPYSARVADIDNGEIKILSSEEPSAVIGTGFTNGTVYYGDTVQCTWNGGTESTSTIVPSPISLSVPELTDAFQGSVNCTIKNNNSYSAKYYWYAMCQASSGPVRIPSSGYYGGSTLAPSASTTVYVASAGKYSYVMINVYFVITGSKTDVFKTYGPKNTSGVTGLYNATTATTAISSTLTKYITTGNENGSNVVVNSTYSETQEGPYNYDIQTNTSSLSLRAT